VNKFYLIALLLAATGGRLNAQTNAFAAPQLVRSQTVITSTVVFFSNAERKLIYSGHVRVEDPQLILVCEQLTADLPSSGGHVDHLVALTNVVMDSVDEKGQTNHATSDMAIYDYKVQDGITNETITLSGNARAETAQVILWGEPIKYDRISGSLTAKNEHTIFKQSLTNTHTNTNQPVGQTNPAALVQQTNLPTAKTNFPPGTIQNIDLMILPNQGR
jgi:lipopolysaccharide export system protein LptA